MTISEHWKRGLGWCTYCARVGPLEEYTEEWKTRVARPPLDPETCLSHRESTTSLQSQSRFFSKLPIELRRIVYEFALGGNTIELVFVGQKGQPYIGPKNQDHKHLLTFPKTCSLAYLEATEAIHRCNSFSISQPACLALLPSVNAPSLLDAIRILKLRFHVGGHNAAIRCVPLWVGRGARHKGIRAHEEAIFDRARDVISRLSGLKSLFVELNTSHYIYPFVLSEKQEAEELVSLRKIKNKLDVFEVTTNWLPRTEPWVTQESLPFKLVVDLEKDPEEDEELEAEEL